MRRNRFFEQLLALPWWVSLCIAAVVFVAITHVLPAVIPAGRASVAVAEGFSRYGWIFSLPFLVAAVSSAVRQWMERRLLDQQKSLDSIRELSWQEFETLIGEAFRRQGYAVTQHGGSTPDGGIDLVLQKAGSKSVVQCKRWQARQVGVTLVRELYGVMTAEGANEAILVTCGEYTEDAGKFAAGKPIRLINAETLLEMIQSVQPASSAAVFRSESQGEVSPGRAAEDAVLNCPKCGSGMVRRTARSGAGAGKEFWGCSTFPKCRGTRPG